MIMNAMNVIQSNTSGQMMVVKSFLKMEISILFKIVNYIDRVTESLNV